jgi:type IV pilus assembly protein PilA
MRKFIQNKLKDQKGLTLIELLAVIVILAIIAAIAIPAIGNIISNSKVGAVKSDFINAVAAAELYMVDNPEATTVTQALLSPSTGEVYLPDTGSLQNFVYNPATKQISGTGTIDKIKIDATLATKAQISSFKNNDAHNIRKGTVANGALLTRQ